MRHDLKCTDVTYISVPINAFGCETEISAIGEAFNFQITDDPSSMHYIYAQHYQEGEHKIESVKGTSNYKQEKIAI